MSQTNPIKDDVLKSYINQIYSRYDTNSNNSLNPTEVTGFFNDLFRSLNLQMVLVPQQSVEIIKLIYPTYNGYINRDELFTVFKFLLTMNSPQQPQQNTSPTITMYPNMGQNGGYVSMPNYVNMSNGFVPQQGYIVNPNMVRTNPQTYPNTYMQNFNGYQNPNQFNNFRRQ